VVAVIICANPRQPTVGLQKGASWAETNGPGQYLLAQVRLVWGYCAQWQVEVLFVDAEQITG
jgi:hypothetical protein